MIWQQYSPPIPPPPPHCHPASLVLVSFSCGRASDSLQLHYFPFRHFYCYSSLLSSYYLLLGAFWASNCWSVWRKSNGQVVRGMVRIDSCMGWDVLTTTDWDTTARHRINNNCEGLSGANLMLQDSPFTGPPRCSVHDPAAAQVFGLNLVLRQVCTNGTIVTICCSIS
jgi:hypothetical protein